MKKGDIFNLVNSGILDITANLLDAAHAYKVVKFKRAIKNAFNGIVEAEKDMLAEVKIADADAFDKEMDALKKSGEDPEKLSDMEARLKRDFPYRKSLERLQIDVCTGDDIPLVGASLI